MSDIHNPQFTKEFRRELRKNLTAAEATLWKFLQNRQLKGKKFRRQHGVGKYILDFYCPSLKLAIELDGDPHFSEEGIRHDEIRTAFLKTLNIRVIRF
jgi:very-short-patch-repair endonuclease